MSLSRSKAAIDRRALRFPTATPFRRRFVIFVRLGPNPNKTGGLMYKFFRRTFVVALAAGATVPGLMVAIAAPAESAPAPYTIALITSLTGEAAPQDVGTVGAFEARLDLQNAQGGIDGHKLVPLVIDDQTSPTAISTGVQVGHLQGCHRHRLGVPSSCF